MDGLIRLDWGSHSHLRSACQMSFWHFEKKRIACGAVHTSSKKIASDAVYYDHAVAKIVIWTLEIILDLPFGFPINNIISLWTLTWVMMICRHTHSRSFFFSLSPPLSLWRTRSPSFSLLFSSVSLLVSLFYTRTDIKQSILNGAP